MKPKVHALSEEYNFTLIAICTHLSDYKISWLFNEELNTRFRQSEDLLFANQKNEDIIKFSTFKSEEDINENLTIYSNHSDGKNLLRSIKNVDYILKYQGDMSEAQLKAFVEGIKKLKNILTAFIINTCDLKQKELEVFI